MVTSSTHSPMILHNQSSQDPVTQSPGDQSQDDRGGGDKISASEFCEAAFCLRDNLHTEHEHWGRGGLLRGRHPSGRLSQGVMMKSALKPHFQVGD